MFLECSKSAINAKKKALIEFYEEVQMVFENRLALLENITTDKLVNNFILSLYLAYNPTRHKS